MTTDNIKAAEEVLYREQKAFILDKLDAFEKLDPSNIYIRGTHPMGWEAVIRTEKLDIVFTYYAENCWKIETFPVYATSGSMLRSQVL